MWTSRGRAPIVAVAALAAGAMVLSTVGCGNGDGETTLGGIGGAEDGSVTEAGGVTYTCPTVDVEVEGDDPIEVVEAGICTYSRGSSDHATYGLVVENTGTEVLADVEVRVEAGTADGRIDLHPIADAIEVLPNGGSFGIGYGVPLEEPADIETLVVHVDGTELARAELDEVPRGDVEVRDASTTLDDDIERTNRFELQSTVGGNLEDLPVYVLYRNPEGAIVGGALDSIDTLPAESMIDPLAHRFTDTYGNPDATTIDVFVNVHALAIGAGADASTEDFCAALGALGGGGVGGPGDPMTIRFTLREGGAAAAELLGLLEGITPPEEITAAWEAMMAGGGRQPAGPTDPLDQAIRDVSSFIIDNCGIPGIS